MKKINWKVRMKHPAFWIALVSAVLILAQQVFGWFGYVIPTNSILHEAEIFINGLFGLFILLGIVSDPTTGGVGDSTQALRYEKPKKGL